MATYTPFFLGLVSTSGSGLTLRDQLLGVSLTLKVIAVLALQMCLVFNFSNQLKEEETM